MRVKDGLALTLDVTHEAIDVHQLRHLGHGGLIGFVAHSDKHDEGHSGGHGGEELLRIDAVLDLSLSF